MKNETSWLCKHRPKYLTSSANVGENLFVYNCAFFQSAISMACVKNANCII